MDYSLFINIVLFIHFILLIIIALRILARDDLTSPARLSWLVVLFLLPYLGVVIYWLFGEVHLGPEFTKKHQQIIDTLHGQHPDVLGKCDDVLHQAIKPEYQAAFAYSGRVTGYFPVAGNAATLMKDADDTRRHMIADFDAATDHIHVLYYIWLEDDMGTATAEALIRAAKRGVTCRVMADGLGSRKFIHSKLWQEMKDAGVQVSIALPFTNFIKVILFSRIDLRNHRKITVIDGRIAYCGSRNCADPEFREKPKYAPWIDIMLRVEGPIVAQNQLLFASD